MSSYNEAKKRILSQKNSKSENSYYDNERSYSSTKKTILKNLDVQREREKYQRLIDDFSEYTNNRTDAKGYISKSQAEAEKYKLASFEQRANEFTDYLNDFSTDKRHYSAEELDSMLSNLSQIAKMSKENSAKWGEIGDYYSQFEDEKAYKSYTDDQTFSKKYAKSTYSDLQKAKADIEKQLSEKDDETLNRELYWLQNHDTDRQYVDKMSKEELENLKNADKVKRDEANAKYNVAKYNYDSVNQTNGIGRVVAGVIDYFSDDYKNPYTTAQNEFLKASSEKEKADTENGTVLYTTDDGVGITADTLLNMRAADEKFNTKNIDSDELKKDLEVMNRARLWLSGQQSDVTKTQLDYENSSLQAKEDMEYLKSKYNIDDNALPYDVYETVKDLEEYAKWRIDSENFASEQKKNTEYATEHPVLATVKSIATAPLTALEFAENVLDGSDFHKGEYGSHNLVNIYDDKYLNQNQTYQSTVADMIDEKVMEKTDSELLSWLSSGAYSGITSSVQSALTTGACMLMFGGAGGTVALGIMGTEAAASSYNNAIMNGSTNGEAILTAVSSGIAEAAFEKISLDKLIDIGKMYDVSSMSALIKSMIKNSGATFVQGGVEASEEFFTEITNKLADEIINGDHSAYNTAVAKYKKMGYSDTDAKEIATKDAVLEVFEALYGGLIGGIGSGAGASVVQGTKATGEAIANEIISNRYYNQMGQNIVANDGVQDLVDKAKGTNSLRKFADKVAGVKAEDLTDDKSVKKYEKNVGKLYKGVTESQLKKLSKTQASETEINSFKELVKAELESAGVENADKVTDVIVKRALNIGKLTREELGLFNSVNGRAVINKVLQSENLKVDEGGDLEQVKSEINSTRDLAKFDLDNFLTKKLLSESAYEVSTDGRTTIQATDEEVDRLTIDSLDGEDVSVKVKTGDSEQIVLASELRLSEDYAVIIESLKNIKDKFGLDVKSANNVLALWESFDGSSAVFAAAVKSGLMYGQYNMRNEFDKNFSVSKIPENIRNRIFEIGREYKQRVVDEQEADAKTNGNANAKKGEFSIKYAEGVTYENLNKSQKAQIDFAQVIAQTFGFNLEIFRSPKNALGKSVGENGSYNLGTNTMRLDIDAGTLDGKSLILFTQSHELTHFIKKWSPIAFKTFADLLVEKYGSKGVSVEKLVNDKITQSIINRGKDHALSYDEAFEEVVCDACEDFLADPNIQQTITEFAKVDKNLAQKIKDFLKGLITKVEEAIKGLQGQSKEASYLREFDVQDLEDLKIYWTSALFDARENVLQARESKAEKNTTDEGDVKQSVREIISESGKSYGIGVYLDSNLLTGLTEDERKQMIKEFVVSELAGQHFIAYDTNNDAVGIGIAKKNDKIRNSKGKKKEILKDLYHKNNDIIVKQEAIVLIDELIANAKYDSSQKPDYSHDWLDNYGQNDWDYWKVFIQEKNKSVWEATLNIANTSNGEKILYDIKPIKMVEEGIKSPSTTTEGIIQQDNGKSQEKFSNRNFLERTYDSLSSAKNENGDELFQYRAIQHDVPEYRALLEKYSDMSSAQIDALFETMNKAFAIIEDNLEILDYAWDENLNEDGTWDDTVDARAFNPVKPNSDKLYKYSLDFSTMCRKRLLQQVIAEELSLALDRAVTKAEGIAIRNELIKLQEEGRQIEIACALCYVESARMKSPEQIQKFLDNAGQMVREFFATKAKSSIAEAEEKARKSVAKKYAKEIKEGSVSPTDTFTTKGGKVKYIPLSKLPKKMKDEIHKAKREAKSSYSPSAEEQRLIDIASNLPVTAFTTAEGLKNLAKDNPVIFDAYTSFVRNATHSKGTEKDVWYRVGDANKIGDDLIAAMNKENGLRSQSWSDFQVIHLLDYVGAIIELSTKKAKMQAYTKVPDYVNLMGLTGQMINLSLIPAKDFNGKLEFDSVEGMAFEVARKLRDKYPDTAGTISIGITNEQIHMLLDSIDIDYVIPYHHSAMSKVVRKAMHIPSWVTYQDYQNEKNITSKKDALANAKKYGVQLLNTSDENYHKAPSFSEWFDLEEARQVAQLENLNPTDLKAQKKYGVMYGAYKAMQQAADNYLKICAERGLVPKFCHEKADFTVEDNYWKLLIDRKMINQKTGEIIEQKPVQPIFNEGEVLNILNNEIARYEDVKKDFDYATRIVTERFLNGEMNEHISEIAKAIGDTVTNVTKVAILNSDIKNQDRVTPEQDAEYVELAKNPEKNEARLRELVAEAAKKTGYNSPKLYHGTAGFGFTKIKTSGVETGVEWSPFFATNNIYTALTYSGVPNKTEIGKKKRPKKSFGTLRDEASMLLSNSENATTGFVDAEYRDSYIEQYGDIMDEGIIRMIKAGVEGAFAVNGSEFKFVPYEDGFTAEDYDSKFGNYGLYAKTEGFLVIDGENREWNKLHSEYGSTTRLIAKNAHNDGYKGVIIRNVYDTGWNWDDSVDEDVDTISDVFVFFNPESQIKSADPVTYDDNGNIIPLSERFNEGNDDIRFQDRKNAEQVEDYFGTTDNYDVAGYITVNGKAIDFSGNKFGAKSNTRTIDHREIGDAFETEAYGEEWGYAGSMLKFMNEGNIRVTPETGGIELMSAPNSKQIPTLKDYIRHFDGKVIVDFDTFKGVDTSDPYNITVDMPVKSVEYSRKTNADKIVSDIINYFEKGVVPSNPSSIRDFLFQDRPISDREILVDAMSNIEELSIEDQNRLEIYKGKIENINELEKELADVGKQIHKIITTKGSDRKQMAELNAKADTLRKQISRVDGELLRIEAMKPIKNLVEIRKKQVLKAHKQKVQEQRHKNVEGRHKTATKNKIKRVINTLESLYSNPSKEKNVKIEFQDMVRDALVLANVLFDDGNISSSDILSGNLTIRLGENERKKVDEWRKVYERRQDYRDKLDALESSGKVNQKTHDELLDMINRCNNKLNRLGRDLSDVVERQKAELNEESLKNAIGSLVKAYKSLKESPEGYAQAAYNDFVATRLETLEESLAKATVKSMTLTQLDELYQAYKMVLTTVRTANDIFVKNKRMSVVDMGEAVISEVKKVANPTDSKVAALKGIREFSWEELKPVYAFERIGSETFMQLYKEVLRGQGVVAQDIAEAQAFFDKMNKTYGYDSWDLKETKDFKLADGRTFTINLQEIMSIYAYSKRDQALDHITNGGFVFDNKEFFTDTKEKGLKGKIKKQRTTVKAYRINDEMFYKIINSLTKEQKKFAEEMQDYLTSMGEKGNEVSRVLYGIDIFNEKHYFPLMSSKAFIQQTNEPVGTVTLKNSGMTKATVPHARNPIVLQGFMDVWANHINKMSTYHGLVLPIENLNKVFNYTGYAHEDESVSVETILSGVYGDEVNKYIENFITDLNGGIKTQSSGGLLMKSVSLFKKTAVSASTSVVIQQPTAIVRAMAMIKPKYFVHGKDGIKHNEAWEKIKKYAPIAIVKEMGGFDVGGGRQVADYITAKEYKGKDKVKGFFTDSTYRDDALMWGATKADEFGWITIWNAVEKEIADTTTYKVGSEEFLQACGERFTEVIDYTQVYDSVLSRSGFMRNKGEISKMATSFMGEPTTSFNMLYNAVLQAKRGNIGKGEMTKIMGATISSIILASIAKSLIYALRDDDEDESYLEKYAQSLTNNLMEDLFIPNMLPYVRDITSLFSGWDVERTDMAIFKDFKDAIDGLKSSNKSLWRKIEDLGGAVAAFRGIPAKNVMRTVREMYNLMANILDDNTASASDIGDAIVETITGETSSSDINEALEKGKTDKAKEIINDLVADKVEEGKTEKEAKASVKASITSYWKALYIQAYRDKDDAEMLRIRQILQSTGLYDNVIETCQNWIKNMKDE